MRKTITGILIFISLFFLNWSNTHAQEESGTFSCLCEAGDLSGACVSWTVGGNNCNSGYVPVATQAQCNSTPGCRVDFPNQECIVACRAQSEIITVPYGATCNPSSPIVRCQQSSATPDQPISCRTSSNNDYRCLKLPNSFDSGEDCKDSTECFGFSSGAFCGFGTCYGDSTSCDLPGNLRPPECPDPTPTPTPAPPGNGGGPPPTQPSNDYICEGRGINTPFGCIDITSPNEFIIQIIGIGASMAGAVALLLIIWASYTIITSTGDPYRLRSGKELLTAAISGVILLIFSVFILNQLGVRILGIF